MPAEASVDKVEKEMLKMKVMGIMINNSVCLPKDKGYLKKILLC